MWRINCLEETLGGAPNIGGWPARAQMTPNDTSEICWSIIWNHKKPAKNLKTYKPTDLKTYKPTSINI